MSNIKKIIIIDDDDMLRDSLKEQFSLHDEFVVTDVASATAGVKAVKADHADLVILDVNLPDMDGREACKIIRRNGYKGPVIMLTGQASDSDRLHARQYPGHLTEVDVAHQPALQRTFHMQFLHRAVFDYGYTGFLRRPVDQNVFLHGTCLFRRFFSCRPYQTLTLNEHSSCAVSNRGSPMMPE